MQANQHLVIIGNGIAGFTLAQQVRRQSNCRITLISAESATHFSRPALMYVYMGHMRYQDIVPYPDWYWQENNLVSMHDRVEEVDFAAKQLQLQSGSSTAYDTLVLATGSCPAFYNWPGQEAAGVQGFVSLQDLELLEKNAKGINHAIVVGGGLIGVELAEMLHSRGIAVSMLVREELYGQNVLPRQEAQLICDHICTQGIALRLQEELAAVLPDATGRVRAVRTTRGEDIACQLVGIATGVRPNVEFLRQTALELDRGILVNAFFETNIPDVYAIGDCAQFRKPGPLSPAIEQLWYTGRMHGQALAATLTGNRRAYARGPSFNSAKFFDLEYQTYGYVPATWSDAYDSIYWQHQNQHKAIRLFYDRASSTLLGLNLIGVRYRHDLCHHWLEKQYTIHQVMQELAAANFDPEFSKTYEQELMQQYREHFPQHQLHRKSSNWWQLRKHFALFSKAASCLQNNR